MVDNTRVMSYATLDKSVNLPERPSWTDQLYKTKPTLLARKIAEEDLFGEMQRQHTNQALMQINEEKGTEADELDIFDSARDEYDNPTGKPANIFKSEHLVSSKFKEIGKFPTFTSNGHVIKHTIVGSADNFDRFNRNIKRMNQKDSAISSEKDNLSFSERSNSKAFKAMPSMNMDQNMSLSRMNTGASAFTKKMMLDKKKENQKELRVSKEMFYNKITNLRKSQEEFYQTETSKYNNLPLGDQLFHSKNQRCLKKFETMNNNWSQTVQNINNKIHRRAGKSVMLRADDHRQKMEEAETFYLVKTDEEKYGVRSWYMTLRNGTNEVEMRKQYRANNFKSISEPMNSTYGASQLGSTGSFFGSSTLEVIKQPNKMGRSGSSGFLPNLSGESRFLDRTRNEYIQEKSERLKTELRKVRPVKYIDTDELMIDGKNKLEMEVTAFYRSVPNNGTYIVPKQLFAARKEEDEGEVLAENKDKKEIAKNGLAALANI